MRKERVGQRRLSTKRKKVSEDGDGPYARGKTKGVRSPSPAWIKTERVKTFNLDRHSGRPCTSCLEEAPLPSWTSLLGTSTPNHYMGI